MAPGGAAVWFAAGALCVRLRVKPGASRHSEGVAAVDDADDDADAAVELRVAAAARDGEANEAALRLLADAAGLPRTRLRLARGARSPRKTVVVEGVAADEGPRLSRAILARLRQAAVRRRRPGG